jgi:hypothetical protein
MQSWRDMAVSYAGTWDSATMTPQSKSITLDATGESVITHQQSRYVPFTIDTIHIPVFMDLGLKHLERTGALTLRTNSWRWNLE